MSLTVGCCYITKIDEGFGPPVIGVVVTDLCEHLPVYSHTVRAEAEVAMVNCLPCYLDVVPSVTSQKRYLKALHVLRKEQMERPCVNCRKPSLLVKSDTSAMPDCYECVSCHFRAYLGRVPRVEYVHV